VRSGSMEVGSCCVLRPNTTASLDDDQIVPDHPGDCSSGGWASSGQSFIDTWLQMQVCHDLDPCSCSILSCLLQAEVTLGLCSSFRATRTAEHKLRAFCDVATKCYV
jgi:hypothetical protein